MGRRPSGLREIAPLGEAFVSPEIKRRYNRRLFGTIADRYDFFTATFSAGQDRRWKRRLMTLLAVRPGSRVLDLACGTGDLAFESSSRGAAVVGLDLTPRMIELARDKAGQQETRQAGRSAVVRGRTAWVVGDMTALPFPPNAFDAVTTGYGLRNVPDLPRAMAEMHRVLEPGGLMGSLDFDRPGHPLVRSLYLGYLSVMGGAVGWALHRDPDTYRYIPASIRRYPGSGPVADLMRAAGFTEVRVIAVLGGLMAIHVARKRG